MAMAVGGPHGQAVMCLINSVASAWGVSEAVTNTGHVELPAAMIVHRAVRCMPSAGAGGLGGGVLGVGDPG